MNEWALKALRAHDIQPGVAGVKSGLVNLHMSKTKTIGAAAQIASLLRGRQVAGMEGLIVAAGDLGIDEHLLSLGLKELQELEYIRLIGSKERIKAVEASIHSSERTYLDLGARFEQLGPTELEQVALSVVDDMAEIPMRTVDIQSRHDLNTRDLTTVKDLGKNCGFLGSYRSPVEATEIMYSPLYWDENPEKVFELTAKYGGNPLITKIKEIRSHQGKPVVQVSDSILLEAIDLGILPTPAVRSTGGEHKFVFSPIKGIRPYEKKILEKARALVSCVRYGESFATITRLNVGLLVLNKLRNVGYFGPHSEIPDQYSLAFKLGIGFFDPEVGNTGKYYFRRNEDAETIKAIELAIQMLSMGTAERLMDEQDLARQALFGEGSYTSAMGTRLTVTLKQEGQYSRDTLMSINDLVRGVSSDILEE